MFESLAMRLNEGGFLMYPLFLLAILSPFLGLGLYALGALLQNKAWALRFAVVNLGLGALVPLLVWLYAKVHTASVLEEVKAQVAPEDWATIQAAAHSEMLALPWAALLSSPWLLSSGLALVGVALLGHPSLAKAPATAPAPGSPLAPPAA